MEVSGVAHNCGGGGISLEGLTLVLTELMSSRGWQQQMGRGNGTDQSLF